MPLDRHRRYIVRDSERTPGSEGVLQQLNDLFRQATNMLIQGSAFDMTKLRPKGERIMSAYARWLVAVDAHGTESWYDELRKRPIALVVPIRHADLIEVEDLVTGARWDCDYQCMRPITEMEALARAAEDQSSTRGR